DFQLGTLTDIKRDEKRIVLGKIVDDNGDIVVNERELPYDYLVMAIGSVSNDFNTKGIKDHCIFLDSPSQAHRFHNSMMN
ncbi:FAD-dependent oxidoreductase, partial [Escherichia coli]|uniref:FAD-dependent oxidoreductase n=2 Tax=Gammaproteobacteria TaxID=1236 RepID=UPI0028DEB6B5